MLRLPAISNVAFGNMLVRADKRDAIYLRYALIPYIYTMARWSYDTGVGMCRPMYYDYPEADEAYRYEGQYMFGNDILGSPRHPVG